MGLVKIAHSADLAGTEGSTCGAKHSEGARGANLDGSVCVVSLWRSLWCVQCLVKHRMLQNWRWGTSAK